MAQQEMQCYQNNMLLLVVYFSEWFLDPINYLKVCNFN